MPTPEITRHGHPEPSGGVSAWVGDARPETGSEVVEPDPRWPEVYAGLARSIREALGDRVLGLQHVMDHNARKQDVVREIYDRAFVALGLLPPGGRPGAAES